MNYTELSITINPYSEEISGILIAELGELDYESFTENEGVLCAYISEKFFNSDILKDLLKSDRFSSFTLNHSFKNIPDQNWNAVWESNFEPVIIGNELLIKAPFHKIEGDYRYKIEIMPKMSFGTGHHATTSTMCEHILEMDFENKKVLDMGCGTGILAILACMRGANDVTAIDIDEWPYKNTIENIQKNNCKNIRVLMGDVSVIPNENFDIILANINLNVLLKDIPAYAAKINKSGHLLVSGFYYHELPQIEEVCNKHGLQIIETRTKNNWCCSRFVKK